MTPSRETAMRTRAPFPTRPPNPDGPELDQLAAETVFLFHSVPDDMTRGTLFVLDRGRLDEGERRDLERLVRKAFRPAVRGPA